MAMPERHDLVDDLARAADQVTVPKGFRVEIIEGDIIVSPTPQGYHVVTTNMLRDALQPLLPHGTLGVEMVTLELPESRQRYIPDLVVMRRAALESPNWLFSASEALLAAEVTSPDNADNDRIEKLRGYATSGVPIYVLIDRGKRLVTVFSEPKGPVYRQHTQVPFGKPVELPDPFAGQLDTATFV